MLISACRFSRQWNHITALDVPFPQRQQVVFYGLRALER